MLQGVSFKFLLTYFIKGSLLYVRVDSSYSALSIRSLNLRSLSASPLLYNSPTRKPGSFADTSAADAADAGIKWVSLIPDPPKFAKTFPVSKITLLYPTFWMGPDKELDPLP